MEFTDEQLALRKLVRDFAEAEIAPHAEAWDASHTFPVEVV
ncbi:MAG: acyl-CoA dehydrogenase family protein, partial [Acidimicrobiales bacterium]